MDNRIEEVMKEVYEDLTASVSSSLPRGVKISDEGWREIFTLLQKEIEEAYAEEHRRWERETA